MPRRVGTVVLIVVALCVAAFYVFVVWTPALGGWDVRQGEGQLVRTARGVSHVDIRYTVKRPQDVLFSYNGLHVGENVGDNAALDFSYQSEWLAMLVVAVSGNSGEVWQAAIRLQAGSQWTPVRLRAADFHLVPGTAAGGAAPRLRWRDLEPTVKFYAGIGPVIPTTAFTNRLLLTAPRVVAAEDLGGTAKGAKEGRKSD